MATGNNESIIRYAEGEMDAAERGQFENRLQSDQELRAELEIYLELKATLQERLTPDATGDSLGQRLTQLNTEYFKPPPFVDSKSLQSADLKAPPSVNLKAQASVRRIIPVRWITAAAAAILVVVAGIYLLRPDRNARLDKLGETTMPGTTERGGGADTLLETAAGWFNKGDFARARPLLDSAVKKDSANQLALLYRGIAAWHTGSIDAARDDWMHIYSGVSLLRYEAAFYLALSYAAGKDKAKALEWVERIPADAPVYSKAKELKNSL